MGILTLKSKIVIPASSVGNAVNLEADADGAVIVKDSLGTERAGFATDLYLKILGVPATVANQGSLYGTGGGTPVAVYRDSTGADVPLVLSGGRWEQRSQVQWFSAALEPYAPPANPHPTGLYVDPPAGEFVIYTLGAYQVLATPALNTAVGVYGEQNIVFLQTVGTADARFAGPQFNGPSGTIFYTDIVIAPDGEIIIYFDASGSGNGTSIAMWMTLTAARLYVV